MTINNIGNGTHVVDLAPGDDVSNLNFGNFELEPGSISGSKWNDLNGDGERDEDEPALAGWTIYLDQNQNGELDEGELSDVTDTDGNYSFSDLPVDTYTVAEVIQPGWQQTFPGANAGNGALVFQDVLPWGSDALQQVLDENEIETEIANSSEMDDINLSSYEVVFIANDQPQGFYDNYDANVSVFADYVNNGGTLWFGAAAWGWNGGDLSNSQLPNEVTISNLYEDYNDVTASDNPLMADVPDPFYGNSASHAVFDNLPENAEVVAQGQNSDLPTLVEYEYGLGDVLAFGQTLEFGYANEQDAGIILENSVPYAFELGGNNHTVELNPGEAVTDIDFGNQEIMPGEIRGIKWNDLNSNGERDEGEPGIANWTIYLDDNQNGELDAGETFTTTNANGEYVFTNVEPGSYTVTEVVEAGWQPTFPVAFEYDYVDSNQPEGPVFDWVDISAVGTPLNLFDDDFAEVELPFTFPFFEQEKTNVKISSNGYLAFGTEAYDYTNDPIPSAQQPNDIIAPFWDDLNPGAGGEIYYYYDETDEQFIVQYQNLPRFEDGGSLTFQTILEADGSILYQYNQMNGTLNSASIGVENTNGSEGLEVAFNEPYVENQFAVSIEPIPGNLQPYNIAVGSGEIVSGIDFGNYDSDPEPEPPDTPIFGTPGDDEIIVVNGSTIVFALSGDDFVDASSSSGNNQLYGQAGDDELIASTGDRLFGGSGNDFLDASQGTGDNVLSAGNGSDILLAGGGDDLFGRNGSDLLFAGDSETLSFVSSLSTSLSTTSNNAIARLVAYRGNSSSAIATDAEDNLLDGGNGEDLLFAGRSDRVFGRNGNDLLFAGDGDNLLTGGRGADQFWIIAGDLPSSVNTVSDFELDTDVLGIGGVDLSFEDLSIVQQGGDALISALETDIAILTGIQADQLNSNNFVFA